MVPITWEEKVHSDETTLYQKKGSNVGQLNHHELIAKTSFQN
jgi:hypothetical protein